MSKKTTKGNYSTKVIKSYGGGLEANTLAMLDSTGSQDTRDIIEDCLQYLEAVRSASLIPENGIPPTNKMYQAIFRILRIGKSLELRTASFQLLIQLHQAWSPFNFRSDVEFGEKETTVGSSFFQQLIQNMNKWLRKSQESDLKILGNMFLFKYLVHVLKLDFMPRNQVFEETMNWSILKDSWLHLLLASRRVNFKLLMKDYLSTICTPIDAEEKSFSFVELHKGMLSAMKELLAVIMELDASKKKAVAAGITGRGDGLRTPAIEIVLDELTYDGYLLSNFLQVFDDPKWKLEIVLLYLIKYIPKPSVRTRRSNGPQTEDLKTLIGVLTIFSTGNNAKNITKKIGADIVQILIGHAFLAWLTSSNSNEGGDSRTEICNRIISAYTCLKRVDQKIEILQFGREVLFTAGMLLSEKAQGI